MLVLQHLKVQYVRFSAISGIIFIKCGHVGLCISKVLLIDFGFFYFQAALSETEKNSEAAEQQLRSNLREILILEAEMENLEQEMKVLQGRCASISVENTRLQAGIREEEEVTQAALEGFGTYRKKMEVHRVAVMQASSQTDELKVLEERRALVRRLTQERDELREDLGNPRGNTAQRAKVEEVDQKVMVKFLNFTNRLLLGREKLML